MTPSRPGATARTRRRGFSILRNITAVMRFQVSPDGQRPPIYSCSRGSIPLRASICCDRATRMSPYRARGPPPSLPGLGRTWRFRACTSRVLSFNERGGAARAATGAGVSRRSVATGGSTRRRSAPVWIWGLGRVSATEKPAGDTLRPVCVGSTHAPPPPWPQGRRG
ncbi:hypothetical protein FA95DRAFT_1552208 [Auriscalpium vulgare]|uniref:Uncharacterized protein n=1 Tax=Auriscalpium vulgare TaxID=40419 RepID=A0ACB8SB21_9AGAM|nr:hypothetical protein FA95DRAFT_1552208 [Auriscalpium vulgare]